VAIVDETSRLLQILLDKGERDERFGVCSLQKRFCTRQLFAETLFVDGFAVGS
jgi:hypothetical protein